MTHNVCGPGPIGIFKKEFGANGEMCPQVWDREKIVIIPDHYIFTADERANRNVDILGDFSKEQSIKYFYDITDRGDFRANPDYKGVCHVALAQEGHCSPGEVLFGTDSHTCTAGASGQFATGIGNTDAGFIMGTGIFLLKASTQIIGEITVSGATYKSMEFVKTAVERMTEYRTDVSKLEPVVAKPHSPDKRALARNCKDVKIDRVYIGSCTGGKTEDVVVAAKLLNKAGQKVKVPTFLVPATQKVWVDLYAMPLPEADGKTCAQIFEEAGCDTPTSPSCAACLGGPKDTLEKLQVCVSTTNRNFPGRMGHKEAQIYLASPYTAATGFVSDCRDFL
ncbi:hypothetical protein SELMODRAFT_421784 [Selaginella moellendorffii]|uniref:Aconitase/3-isopropylmalate dehydratase large subunit alpha/beta/alpha domain-containing protein n=1 Tax=Selaginella moellendorffii TaxID=88036 RepID=D8SGC5_SELML|nr:hypothetical protein SELMODRAFT_421784 [Selaginella moellendorffii]